MDTLTLERDNRTLEDRDEVVVQDVPTGILTHDPEQAEPGFEQVWPEASGTAKPTYLHPLVLVAAASGYAWFALVFWVTFWGFGYMGFTMVIVTLTGALMLGLLAAGGGGGRNVQPWERPWRSFRESLSGEVEVWGGRVSGWDAFVQLAGMAWLLAGLATIFGIIIMVVRTTTPGY